MIKSVAIFCIIVTVIILPILSHNVYADLTTNGNIEQNVGNGETQMYVSSVQTFSSQTTKLIHVNVIFKNLSYKPQSFNLLFMGLTDNNGNSYNPEIDSKFSSVEIPSMDTVDGEIIFSIPATATPTNFSYQTFGANPISVDLTQTQNPPDSAPQSGWILGPNVGYDANDGISELKINSENWVGNSYVVNVSITNVGQDTIPYNPLYAYVKDASGKVYSWSPFSNVSNQLSSGNLSPSQSVSGDIAFDVGSTSGTNLMFIWDSTLGSGSYFNTGKLGNNIPPVNTQSSSNQNQSSSTLNPTSPTTENNQPAISPQISNFTLFTTYKNSEYNFSLEYPKAWNVEENYASTLHGNLGIVDFSYDSQNYTLDVSVWGKITNVTSTGNQYLNQMSDYLRQSCNNKTVSKDGLTCTYTPMGANIINTKGKQVYLVIYREQITEAPNSTYQNEIDTCLQAHITYGSDLWELNSCDDENVGDNPNFSNLIENIWSGIASNSIATFTVTETPPLAIATNSTSINAPISNSNMIQIPQWVHNNAKWWSEGSLGDNDFVQGVQYLIQQKIIVIPKTTLSSTQHTNQIPPWVKGVAGWWASGKISDEEFIKGIQFLVEAGIIKV